MDVKAKFVPCKLESLSFDKDLEILQYKIGPGIPVKIKLPEIESKPDCGYEFT